MRIYISGKITGTTDYKERFLAAEKEIRDGIDKDAEIFNPATIEIENGEWKDYMLECIKHLVRADAVFMLRGWWLSRGARVEHRLARKLGFIIYYEV